jgi:hypothetical protein
MDERMEGVVLHILSFLSIPEARTIVSTINASSLSALKHFPTFFSSTHCKYTL